MSEKTANLIFISNWKMHGTKSSVTSFAKSLLSLTKEISDKAALIFCPPACYLSQASSVVSGASQSVYVGGQSVHAEEKGAHTGAVAAVMLKDMGCTYTLVGHSEDREMRHLTNEGVAQQAVAAQQAELIPVICIGESLAQYEAGETLAVLEQQVLAARAAITSGDYLLAYEPIWAIGSGKTPTLDEIENAHQHCKRVAQNIGDNSQTSGDTKPQVLYGGSVKSENVAGIMALASVDGALVGSASLSETGFAQLVRSGVET